MRKSYSIKKSELENIAVNETGDLCSVMLQVRGIKLMVEALEKSLDNMGVGVYGSTSKQVVLKDYIVDDSDNLIVKSQESRY